MSYHIVGKLGGDYVWQKWMDKDFGKKLGKWIDQPKGCWWFAKFANRTAKQFHYTIYNFVLYVLLKALPPVCIKYTAQGESRVTNIAWG